MTVLQFGLTPKAKPVSPKRSALVAALDVGTSKIACLIARLKPQSGQDVARQRTHSVEVIGFGHTYARGIKGGAVVDLQAAEEAMRQAVDLAERSAKLQLESVMVSISAGKPASELMSASITINGSTVANHDIARVIAAGSRHSARPGRAVLH
jgi:cell division protein FtsA